MLLFEAGGTSFWPFGIVMAAAAPPRAAAAVTRGVAKQGAAPSNRKVTCPHFPVVLSRIANYHWLARWLTIQGDDDAHVAMHLPREARLGEGVLAFARQALAHSQTRGTRGRSALDDLRGARGRGGRSADFRRDL